MLQVQRRKRDSNIWRHRKFFRGALVSLRGEPDADEKIKKFLKSFDEARDGIVEEAFAISKASEGALSYFEALELTRSEKRVILAFLEKQRKEIEKMTKKGNTKTLAPPGFKI
jgi:hypothetical protein